MVYTFFYDKIPIWYNFFSPMSVVDVQQWFKGDDDDANERQPTTTQENGS